MSRAIIIAKIRRQKAEVDEVIAELREEAINPKVIELLKNIKHDANSLIEALYDKSIIPREHEDLDVETEVKKIGKRIERVKENVGRIKRLEKERERLENEIKNEIKKEKEKN